MIAALIFGIDAFFVSNYLIAGDFIIFFGALIVGINWSINITREYSNRIKERNRMTVIVSLTVFITALLPLILMGLISLFDKLDLIQE